MKPLQEQLDELTAKGELSKEDKGRLYAIRNAIKILQRALGDRSEDADLHADKLRERAGKKGADRRPELREERVEHQLRLEQAPGRDLSPDDSLSDDRTYQELQNTVAELKRSLAKIQRAVRSPNDPALRAKNRALESAEKEMAAYPQKVREEARQKIADLDKARAELREQGTELSRKRAEFMEAEQRYQESQRRVAELERPDRKFTARVTIPDGLNLPGSLTEIYSNFPFPRLGGGLTPSGNVILRTPEIRDMRRSPDDESRRISELEKKLDRVLEEVKGLKAEKESKSE